VRVDGELVRYRGLIPLFPAALPLGVRAVLSWLPGGRSVANTLDRVLRGSGLPSISTLVDLHLALSRLGQLSDLVPPDAPWEAPDAAYLDAETVSTAFIGAGEGDDVSGGAGRQVLPFGSRRARAMLSVAAHSLLTSEPSRVSWLFMLHYARAAGGKGGLDRLLNVEGGAQNWKVQGGMARLAETLAASMLVAGGSVVTNNADEEPQWSPAIQSPARLVSEEKTPTAFARPRGNMLIVGDAVLAVRQGASAVAASVSPSASPRSAPSPAPRLSEADEVFFSQPDDDMEPDMGLRRESFSAASGLTKPVAPVCVQTASGRTLWAQRVIVAVPPSLVASRIAFHPPLPLRQRAAMEALKMGCVIKCIAFYETAWWSPGGLNGMVTDSHGPVRFGFDTTLEDGVDENGEPRTRPALVGFITGHQALLYSEIGADERRRAVLGHFALLLSGSTSSPLTSASMSASASASASASTSATFSFPFGTAAPVAASATRPSLQTAAAKARDVSEGRVTSGAESLGLVSDDVAAGHPALSPLRYVDRDWSTEEWSGGCYVGCCPPGVLSDLCVNMARPHAAVHFAATETATMWPGYIDGAVQAGIRAAHEVMTRL
jgi:hypothetical protein